MPDNEGVTGSNMSQQRQEELLTESLSRLKATLDSTADGILVVDNTGKITDYNEQFARLWHIPDEILELHDDQKALDFVFDQLKDPDSFMAKIKELYAHPEAVSFDVLEFRDGRIFERYSQPQKMDGVPVGRVWSFRDVTEQRRTVRALRQSEERLQAIYHTINEAIFIHDMETGRIVDVNQKMCELYGVTLEEALNWTPEDGSAGYPPYTPAEAAEFIRKAALGQPQLFEWHARHKDGQLFWVEVGLNRARLGEKDFIIASVRDISKRKEAEEKISRMLNEHRTILNTLTVGLGYLKNRHIQWANPAHDRIFGYNPGETKGRSTRIFYADEEAFERVGSDGYKRLAAGEIFETEERMRKKDGTEIWCKLVGQAIDPSDLDSGSIWMVEDITSSRAAEDALRQNEEFIRNVLDSVGESFLVIDRDLRILSANRAYCNELGLTSEDIKGRYCYEITHKTHRPCYEEGEECSVRQTFLTGRSHYCMHRHINGEGRVALIETRSFPMHDQDGRVVSVIETMNDVTEKHMLEEEQAKVQKLESIGTLAGGIAHDFNNLLHGLFGFISLAKMQIEPSHKSFEMLNEAEKALNMSVELSNQLLTFSKGGAPLKKVISLVPLVEESVRFTLSGSQTDFTLKVADGLFDIEADEAQLRQAIQNIVLNAAQAMPEGGTVKVSARNVCTPGNGAPLSLPDGCYVELSIQDTGVGIPPEILPRIFDPYFTTQKMGSRKGTGLGLTIAYSVIKKHGGTIEARSEHGKGSTFSVYIPAFHPGSNVGVPAEKPATERKKKVLVMDDEEIVGNVVRQMLESINMESEIVKNGEAALERYKAEKEQGNPFDLVILDLTVKGGMGGDHCMKELLKIDPDVRAIVSSGHTDSPVLMNFRDYGFLAFLKKPYRFETLREALDSTLG